MNAETLWTARGSEQDRIHRFVTLAEQTVCYAEMANCCLQPFAGTDLPCFRRLTADQQMRVIEHLEVYNQICAETLMSGKSLRDSVALTWHALKKFNLHFPSDLFSYITDENVIEVYDRENVQIFRNFRFFDFSSYSLEDLLCRSWPELFTRGNEDHTQSIIETTNRFYSKELASVTSLRHVGAHRISESDSPYSYVMDATIDYLAPLYEKSKMPFGFVAIETPQMISEKPFGTVAEQMLKSFYQKKAEFSQASY